MEDGNILQLLHCVDTDRVLTAKSPIKKYNIYNTAKYSADFIKEDTRYSM